MARPNRYETEVKDKLILVEGWARDGLTNEQIANNLGIGIRTLYEYRDKYPQFSHALKRGKEVIDREVENSLLRKALGFKETVKKAIKIKNVEYSNGKRLRETEEVVLVDEEVFVPPDTTANIFWLKNRKPKEWRDKQEIETSGETTVNTKIDFSNLTTDQIRELLKNED